MQIKVSLNFVCDDYMCGEKMLIEKSCLDIVLTESRALCSQFLVREELCHWIGLAWLQQMILH